MSIYDASRLDNICCQECSNWIAGYPCAVCGCLGRDSSIDPWAGDHVQHRDGGTMYVVGRKPRMVLVKRRPVGDSLGDARWMRLTTFQREAVG